MRSYGLLFLLALLGLSESFLPAATKAPRVLDLNDTIATNRILTKFASLVQAADLAVFLSSRGPFTVFAPVDSAFSKLPPGTFETLMLPQNKEIVQRIVLYHIFSGKSTSAKDLQTIPSLISAEGLPWKIKKSRVGTQYIEKAKLTHADIHCLNGVLHQVDTLLVPADAPLSSLNKDAPPATIATPDTTTSAPAPAPQGVPALMQTNAPTEKQSD